MNHGLGTLSVALACTSGCAFIDDFGKFEIADAADAAQDGDADPDGDAGEVDAGPPDLTCVDGVLGAPPVEVAVDTAEREDDYEGSCGGAGAPDVAYQWTAPREDFYRFHTTGSDMETVLYLRDGTCDGEELGCSDEQEGPYRSEIIEKLDQWQRVVAVVDGRSGDSGDAILNVEAVQCPAIHLTDTILPVSQSTQGRTPYGAGTCVSDEHGARTYRFTAPEDGHYSFLAVHDEEGFRPAVMVEKGPACGGPRLQCNSGDDGRAEVLRYLAEGEHVTVIVAGHDGDGPFSLNVERQGDDTCVDTEYVAQGPTGGNVYEGVLSRTDPHRMTTSCGPASVGGDTDPADGMSLPDFNARVTPVGPLSDLCSGGCSVSVRGTFPFFLALSEEGAHGKCAGRELSCAEAMRTREGSSPSDPSEYEASLSLPADGVPRVLTIDRDILVSFMVQPPWADDFELEVWCSIACS